MLLIQYVFSVLFIVLIGYSLIRPFDNFLPRSFLLVGSVLGLLSVVNVKYTNYIAEYLGVGRGADIYLYLGLITTFLYIYYTVVRFRSLEKKISDLAKYIALGLTDKHKTFHDGS